ncbi:uncharacterized protein A1O5_06334 [Cladophialophora psammophila CBS 110553]|uniref:SnoaL-like domain-containing protein n=1 Tax=Cladophialophora psammophila CBS 110553 TaxID=1182543 RepID=W9X017_9EURO|nr:uncharacterized protein A1O5_06334 [Cladophialophora psammophila CBS 110553]EXJ70266.1 hypothetical protein A1O5_06334 [Cladophialophora psammophila CBS 110553]
MGSISLSEGELRVRKLFSAFERGTEDSVEAVLELFAEDAIFYVWGPTLPPAVGHDAMRTAFKGLSTVLQDFKADLGTVAVSGNVVFVERVERFTYKGKKAIELPLVGVGEIRPSDGKFTLWKDYFDSKVFADVQ